MCIRDRVSTDYNIFTFENASGALVSERFASVPYEPLALGFSGGELIVADTTGYINVFSGNRDVYKRQPLRISP